MNQANISSRVSYHLSCDTLIYGTFIKILVTDNIDLLIIEGQPDKQLLEEAWDSIKAEFAESIQTEKSESLFVAWKKIVECELKKKTVSLLIYCLRRKYNKDLAEHLALLGYDLVEDDSQLLKRLTLIETEAKNLDMFLNQYKTDYLLLYGGDDNEQTGEVKKNFIDYDKELAALSKYMGYRIDKESIRTNEYIAIFNLFIKENSKKQRRG